jgi:hypothetical protein
MLEVGYPAACLDEAAIKERDRAREIGPDLN